MSFLELRNVSKAYGTGPAEVHALENIDVSVDRGALVAVMGPSGSGKSTLLTIAGSLEEPTSGEVTIGGAALTAMSRNDKARLRRRTIGYVFQDFNLLPGLTAAENVCLPLELDGMRARKAHAAGMAVLEELGIADRSTHYPDELSGGERQRVSILACTWPPRSPRCNIASAASTSSRTRPSPFPAPSTPTICAPRIPAARSGSRCSRWSAGTTPPMLARSP